MKIGLVSPYYMHRPGGVQTLLLLYKDALVKRGHDVSIIAPRPKPEFIEDTPKDVLLLGRSTEIKFRAPFHTTHPIARADKEEIDSFLRKNAFDVLNVHEPWMPMLPYQVVQAANCPVVGTLHARWPRSAVNRSLEKARGPYVRSVMRRLDVINASSSVSAQNAYDVDPDAEVLVTPNALSVSDFQKQINASKTPGGSPYILYLNRLEKRKGPMHLLRAYKAYCESYPSKEIRLIIAGTGPQEDRLKEYAAKHELDGVDFLGYVSDERKIELFANASLYVSPAPYGESFGVVLIEAMAAGVPVVAGNNEGYQTVLKGEGALSLVDPKDVSSFSERIHVMLNNDDVRRAWLNWATKDVLQYDTDKVVDLYEQAYVKAINTWEAKSSK